MKYRINSVAEVTGFALPALQFSDCLALTVICDNLAQAHFIGESLSKQIDGSGWTSNAAGDRVEYRTSVVDILPVGASLPQGEGHYVYMGKAQKLAPEPVYDKRVTLTADEAFELLVPELERRAKKVSTTIEGANGRWVLRPSFETFKKGEVQAQVHIGKTVIVQAETMGAIVPDEVKRLQKLLEEYFK